MIRRVKAVLSSASLLLASLFLLRLLHPVPALAAGVTTPASASGYALPSNSDLSFEGLPLFTRSLSPDTFSPGPHAPVSSAAPLPYFDPLTSEDCSLAVLALDPDQTCPASDSAPAATPLLPDLSPLPPGDLFITGGTNGRRLLHLTTSFANLGAGPLEMAGINRESTSRTAVTQYVSTAGEQVIERPAGEFIYHPTHYHWHLEDFARYELWTLTDTGHLDQQAAVTGKVSFCLRDIRRARTGFPADPARYLTCGRGMQGISAGWVDTYTYDTPGQFIDVTLLPDGLYALRLVVDPLDHIWESIDTNNTARVTIEIKSRQVRILDDSQEVRDLLKSRQAREAL